MTADYFGENNNASNYGLVYSSKLMSGLVGSGLGALVVERLGLRRCVRARRRHRSRFRGPRGVPACAGPAEAKRIEPNPQPIGEEMA